MESVTADTYPSPHSPDVALYGNPETLPTPGQDIGPSKATDVSNDELRTPSFDSGTITSSQMIFLINTLAAVTKGGWYDCRLSNIDHDSLNQTSQTSYKEMVKKPVDLHTMKSNLKHAVYASVDAFFGDVDLLVSNTASFYSSDHTTTRDARLIRERLLKAMNRLPKQSDQVLPTITPKSEPSATGKKRTNDLMNFFKPMSELSAKRARGGHTAHSPNTTLRTSIKGFRMPPFVEQGSTPATPGPVALVAPMYHVVQAAPVARPLVPEELVEAQKLLGTLTEAISKVSEAHPQMAQHISELNKKVSEVTDNVAQALSTMQGQIKAMKEMVANAMTTQQELQERYARLDDTVTSLESVTTLGHTGKNETTRALGGTGTYEVTGVYGGVGTREVVNLDGVQLPNNVHHSVFPYQLPTGPNPPPFPFV